MIPCRFVLLLAMTCAFLPAQDSAGCPATLEMQGKSAKGGHLQSKFTNPEPATIEVKGTGDVSKVAGGSGRWTSRDRYLSLNQTLIGYDAEGRQILACHFDENGDLVLPKVILSEFRVEAALGHSGAVITWTLSREVDVNAYCIDRMLVGAASFDECVQVDFPLGPGVTHTVTDDAGTGDYLYRLRVIYIDGTFEILDEATVSSA